jgi:hypothetical protein
MLLNVNSEHTYSRGILNNGKVHALSKLSPGGLNQLVPSHLDHLLLICLGEVNSGIELSNNVFINNMVELHQWQESQLLTNAFGLAKVLRKLVHMANINSVIGAKRTLFFP